MYVVVFKQKTAYEMRISDWSPDVCSSDLTPEPVDEIVLFDMVAPANLPHGLDERVKIASGQIAERDQVFHIIDRDDIGVFHLASVVSGDGEQDRKCVAEGKSVSGRVYHGCRRKLKKKKKTEEAKRK